MKFNFLLMSFILCISFLGCSKEATDAAKSDDVNPKLNEGLWVEKSTKLKNAITDVQTFFKGMGRIIEYGTAYPLSAKDDYPMRNIEHQSGRYWEAQNYTLYPPNTWKPGNII